MKKSLPRQTLVPISEAAKFLGVSIDTIRRWDKSGIIHSERKNGKDRLFSLKDLEKHKSVKPLSISEASKLLNISATTLRRLEKRGEIKPQRNSIGERIYDQKEIKRLLDNKYFLRKKLLRENRPAKANNKKVIKLAPSTSILGTKILETNEPAVEASSDHGIYKLFGFVGAIVIFLLLTGIGLINVQVSAAQSDQYTASNEISILTKVSSPTRSLGIDLNLFVSPTPSPIAANTTDNEIKPLTIKVLGLQSPLNLDQKTATESSSAGSLSNEFEISSIDAQGYHVRLPDGSVGFIPLERVQKEATSESE